MQANVASGRIVNISARVERALIPSQLKSARKSTILQFEAKRPGNDFTSPPDNGSWTVNADLTQGPRRHTRRDRP
jgi:hypothetical protein